MTEVAIRAKIKLQNAYIAKLIDEFGSAKAAAEELGISDATLGHWLNFKTSPGHRWLKTERMKKVMTKLCRLTEASLKDIFPDLTAEERAILSEERVQDTVVSTERITSEVQNQYLTYEVDLDKTLDVQANKEMMNHLLKFLSERERSIIKLRYGMPDGNPLTLAETGHVLKMSVERVRQIERRAIGRLQRMAVMDQGIVDTVGSGCQCLRCEERFHDPEEFSDHVQQCGVIS